MLISLCSLSFSQLIFADSFLEICFSRSAICVCNHHSPHYIYHCVFHIFHILMLTLMAVFIKCGNIWFYCSFIKSIMECNCMKPYKFLTLRLLKQCIYAWSIKVYTAYKTNNLIICIITINILAWLTLISVLTDLYDWQSNAPCTITPTRWSLRWSEWSVWMETDWWWTVPSTPRHSTPPTVITRF